MLHSTSAVGTQILLTHGSEHLLVDVGDGTVRDLISRKVSFEKIQAILLTHEHFDHFSGLYGLLHFCRLLRRKEELILVGPQPVQVVRHFLTPPVMYETLPFEIRLIEVSEGENISVGQLNVTAFAVEHTSANALGYSIQDKKGYRVVISGDATISTNLARNVEGADFAVLEATYDDRDADLASRYGHMTKTQAKSLGKTAKKVVYVHSSPNHYVKKFVCTSR